MQPIPDEATAPTRPEDLLRRLDELGLETATQQHAPLFTVEDSVAVRSSLPPGSPGGPGVPQQPAAHCKNLFLKNKKGDLWLCSMCEDRQVDLKALGAALGGQRLSFASPERLWQHLGVRPGAVTPFAVINDRACVVQVLLDAAFPTYHWLHFHPLVNDRTTMIRPDGLLRFLRSTGHEPRYIEF